MKKEESIENLIKCVSSICLSLEQVLFQRQIQIGRLMVAQVGKGLKPAGGRKGPQEGSIMTLATLLSKGVKKSTGANYSPSWFKYCHLYAQKFDDNDVFILVRHHITQSWLMRLCGKSDAKRKDIIQGLGKETKVQHLTAISPKSSPEYSLSQHKELPLNARGRVEEEPENFVTISITMSPEAIADKLAFLLRRERDADRRSKIKWEIIDVMRRV